MGTFTQATAVTGQDGTFHADLDPQWAVGTKLHGGYLLAVLGRAALIGQEHPHLTTISGTFLVSPGPGPAEIRVETLRSGRTTANLRAQLVQGGRICLDAQLTLGVLDEADSWWAREEPVELPEEAACFRSPADAGGGFTIPLFDVVEQRLHPGNLGFAVGQPGRTGSIAGWQRLADGSDWDPLSLLVALDPVPPVSYDLGIPGWVPTIQLTAYLRRLPAPGAVRVRLRADDVVGERMDETAHVWDAKGRLVAQATQYAAVRLPG
ncbi:thioesterase family protein [Nonomuraea sp. NPDC050310]|uniref:thioesterase family protein n=1 Tax=Nonomuraea sp. NPDC050310 TaxID=3154935 RepID=UPI0033C5B482